MHSHLHIITPHQPKTTRTFSRRNHKAILHTKARSKISRFNFGGFDFGDKNYLGFCVVDNLGKVAHFGTSKISAHTLTVTTHSFHCIPRARAMPLELISKAFSFVSPSFRPPSYHREFTAALNKVNELLVLRGEHDVRSRAPSQSTKMSGDEKIWENWVAGARDWLNQDMNRVGEHRIWRVEKKSERTAWSFFFKKAPKDLEIKM